MFTKIYKESPICRLLLLTGLLLALGTAAEAQQVSEYVRADTLQVGDSFEYTVVLSKDREYDQVLFPDSSHFVDGIEIRSRQHYRVTDFRDSLVYKLQFFATEDLRIPSLPVQLVAGTDTTRLYTTPVPISFSSVLQSDQEEFRPLKPIFDFARAWWPYMLAVLLLLLLGWYLYRWYRQKSAEPTPEPQPEFTPQPFVDPLSQLESSINQLRSFTFEDDEDFKQFYINLGDAIRTYFEDLYNIPALESTSREIIYELEHRMVNEEMITQTRKVLRQADMVKFARFQPTEEQTQVSLAIAREFIETARRTDEAKIKRKRKQHEQNVERQRQAYHENREQTELQEA
ncbi:MAG: hypothetical protein R3281_09675 [Balneolaceae bacterium]|nr:hypothetical protein [Balneolaceae bacterium]